MMFKPLIQWSLENFSNLPWRANRSLYGTLVSEIMLQQTTVGTVINYFEKFLQRYPGLHELAQTTEEELTIAWKGLGYYRRANNLLKAARTLVEEYGGEIPLDQQKLLTIPGIGPYTANALLAIGADLPFLAIDANLERVLSRLFLFEAKQGKELQAEILRHFSSHTIGGRDLNEALMDLGRTFCKSKNPQCHLCPLQKQCRVFIERPHERENYPQKKEGKSVKFHELHLLRVIVKKGNSVLAYQKKQDEWLAGQWELPTFILSSEDEGLNQYPKISSSFKEYVLKKNLKSFKTSITKYKILNSIINIESEKEFLQLLKKSSQAWCFKKGDLQKENFSTASIKALNFDSFYKKDREEL